ncbi:MAG: TniQ family protein [Rhodocyclaceae bacterium]|nr:TniQ family protein [Rhodocyclaceae bacterium]
MTLLIRPQAEIGEGPRGYLSRLAEANRLTVMDLSKMQLAFHAETLRRERCAPVRGINPLLDNYLESVSAQLANHPGAWVHRHARFCPQCLQASGYWQFGWELLFADACPIHGIWLIDACSSCGQALTWRRARLLRCDCGRTFAGHAAVACPPAVSHLSRVVTEKLLGETSSHALGTTDGLDVEQLQRLIRFLGCYTDTDPGPRPQKIVNLDRLSVSWRLVSLAAEVIEQWPTSLHAVLDRMQRERATDGGGRLGGRFGYFYTALYRGFPEPEFAPLRDAFENYVAEHWRGALGHRNRRLPAGILQRAAWIPANHACDQLGISRRRLTQLIGANKIAGETRVGLTGRTFIVVRREDVARQLLQIEQEVDLFEAARMLGLTKRRMQSLVVRLFPEAYRPESAGTPWTIPRGRLDALVGIADQLNSAETIEDGAVAFGHVLQFWPWTDATVADALAAVIARTLVPVAALRGISGVPALIFREEDLRVWHAGTHPLATGLLTVPQVADRIGIKQEVAYALVRSGLLSSQAIDHGKKRDVAWVSPAELEAFGRRYRFARDLAGSMGCSPRWLIDGLGLLGVRPISGPHIDGCRQVVYESTHALRQMVVKLRAFRRNRR